jgi:hypothetical protein
MKDYIPTENYKYRIKSATLNERKTVVCDTVQREHTMQVRYSEQKDGSLRYCTEETHNASALLRAERGI